MTRIAKVLVVTLVLVAAVGWADEQTRWINVHVTEPETDTVVEVHLPLDLVVTVLEGVKVENFHYGKVDLEIDDADIDWLKIFAAVKDAPDGEFVTAKTEDADVKVAKRQGTVHIHVVEHDGDNVEADVTMPVEIIDALTIDDDNRIDVVALLQSFADLPDGDLVRVRSDDANVRIWIE